MNSQIYHLQLLLNTTFEKGAWHGPSVKEVLATIDEKSANFRLSNTHSIIELVAHIKAWRIIFIHKLQGDLDYSVSHSINFSVTTGWLTAMKEREENKAKLIQESASSPLCGWMNICNIQPINRLFKRYCTVFNTPMYTPRCRFYWSKNLLLTNGCQSKILNFF